MSEYLDSEILNRLQDHLMTLMKDNRSVPVLTQIFCVFRRITWYLYNVETKKKWIKYFVPCSSSPFLAQVDFILASCTNGNFYNRNLSLAHAVNYVFFT